MVHWKYKACLSGECAPKYELQSVISIRATALALHLHLKTVINCEHSKLITACVYMLAQLTAWDRSSDIWSGHFQKEKAAEKSKVIHGFLTSWLIFPWSRQHPPFISFESKTLLFGSMRWTKATALRAYMGGDWTSLTFLQVFLSQDVSSVLKPKGGDFQASKP